MTVIHYPRLTVRFGRGPSGLKNMTLDRGPNSLSTFVDRPPPQAPLKKSCGAVRSCLVAWRAHNALSVGNILN